MSVEFHRSPFAAAKHKLFHGLAMCAVMAVALAATARVIAPPETHRKLDLNSSAFKDGQAIPAQYTCDGRNISPPLAWNGAPSGTSCFVLIVDDPDSPTGIWTHWTVFNLPPDVSQLAENFIKSPTALGTAKEGMNSFKNVGYGGPCPPEGKQHRYYFKLFALDTTLNLQSGASRQDVEAAMAKHILAMGQLMGTYQRK